MSAEFQTRLGEELGRVGIRGRLRGRILAEYADHLACDPEAQVGEPRALAQQFADELGSARARRAAVTASGALALAGILFGLAFVTSDALYGVTPKGGRATHDDGTFYRIDAAGHYELLYTFTCPAACAPDSPLVEIAPGQFVGTTRQGGVEKYGTDYLMQVD